MKKISFLLLIFGTVLFSYSGVVRAADCSAAFDYSGACGRNCMMANPDCGLRGCVALCSGAVGQGGTVTSVNANNNVVVQRDAADAVLVSDNTVTRAGAVNRAGTANRAGDVNRVGTVNRVGDVNRVGTVNRVGDVNRAGSVNRTTTANRAGGVNRTGTANRSAGNRNGGVNRAGARR